MPSPEVRRARELVLRFGWNAMAYQILNPGMRLWFAADGQGVAGYVRAGGYRVVAGAPVCAPERLAQVEQFIGAETLDYSATDVMAELERRGMPWALVHGQGEARYESALAAITA